MNKTNDGCSLYFNTNACRFPAVFRESNRMPKLMKSIISAISIEKFPFLFYNRYAVCVSSLSVK